MNAYKELILTGTTAKNKIFDGTATSTRITTASALSGVVTKCRLSMPRVYQWLYRGNLGGQKRHLDPVGLKRNGNETTGQSPAWAVGLGGLMSLF